MIDSTKYHLQPTNPAFGFMTPNQKEKIIEDAEKDEKPILADEENH